MALQGPIPVEFGTCSRTGRSRPGASSRCGTSTHRSGDRFVQAKDKATGLPVWVVEVIDADPAARDKTAGSRSRREQPVLPAAASRDAVRPGGVHRADGHAVRQPGRAAGLLAQGGRGPRPAAPRELRADGRGDARREPARQADSFGRASAEVGPDSWRVTPHVHRRRACPA